MRCRATVCAVRCPALVPCGWRRAWFTRRSEAQHPPSCLHVATIHPPTHPFARPVHAQLFWNNDYSTCPFFAKYAKTKWDFAGSSVWTWSDAARFAEVRGIPVLWQINAAVGGVCGVGAAADLAAAFVKNATASGFPVELIEVGNENYGDWYVRFRQFFLYLGHFELDARGHT